jgi:hypothetical protein
LICAIVIKSLDGSLEQHFAIHIEADKANIPYEEIENSYRDLEFRTLKAFNDFVKRHSQNLWLHWDMKNIKFGFEAIKHRFEKLFSGLRERREEIPLNNRINIRQLLESMYGEKFAITDDKLASIMKENNGRILDQQYLTLDRESMEFERKNYTAVINSLDCKVDFLCRAVIQLNRKKLKVVNKNFNAVYSDVVNHPTFTFIGWIFGFLGLILTIMAMI